MDLMDLTINDFTSELGSASPAPGGGSTAALCGTLGAALCRMVAALTLDRKKYESAGPQMRDLAEKAEQIEKKLADLVNEDTRAYLRVMDAFRLPKDSDQQIHLRKAAIQDALKAAADVPYQTLNQAAELMDLAETACSMGNPNCITDAGVAAELVNTAVFGAAYNVGINLCDIDDAVFVSDVKTRTNKLLDSVQERTAAIRKNVLYAVRLKE